MTLYSGLFIVVLVAFFLTELCSMLDLISLTRDRTPAHYSGSAESEPPDCQGSPGVLFVFFY